MGEVNFIPGRVTALDPTSATVETALGTVTLSLTAFTAGAPIAGQAVTFCIRPEHFRRAEGEQANLVSLGQARITGQAFFGTHYRCHLAPDAAPDLSLVVHMRQSTHVSDGDAVPLAVPAKDVVVLPGTTKDT
ncbi:TOBE domain-containing protein [Rhizobium sp. 32-5/1]|nr:TOBE domain-containing protein [Rhizobium sp. 32-5/1]WEZ85123.1 TOBE domain-containing protein [Rhizobium sp. 32-5/1]